VLVRLGLAALSGLLTFAAFPGVGAWPLAFVAWVPLLLALAGMPLRRAAALGFVAGFFAALPGLRFVIPALRAESGFGPLGCGLILVAIALYHALRGLVIGAVSRAWSTDTAPPSLSFAAGLAASEIAVPSLFPWYFGASVHDLPLLIQPAELLGPVAVSVVLALSSVAVAETIAALRDGRRTRPRVIVTAIAIPIAAAFWGSVRIPAIDAAGRASPAIAVGVVQPNLAGAGEIETALHHREATRDLAGRGAGLVVWAEGALPWTVPAPFAEDTLALLRVPDVPLLTGALVQGSAPGAPETSTRLSNSALLFDGGRLIGRYDKHRLLPFSETLPLERTFPWLRDLSPRSGDFAPGDTYAPLAFRGHPMAVFICYEDLFPGHVRALSRRGDVELLVNLTNDSWFSGTDEQRVHLALAKLRAVEQRKYLVRATLTGKSAIVDPAGRLLGAVPEDRAGTLLAEVRWMRGTTVYNFVGDVPWWIFVVGVLVYAYREHRRGLASRRGGAASLPVDAPVSRLDDVCLHGPG
jgi:apolipoprotein N-acyltransferase